MLNKFNYYWLLILIPVIFIGWYFVSKKSGEPIRYLEYFEPKNNVKLSNSEHHSIPDFEFINQDGEKFTKQNVKNKIYVTEYFFTTCKSICPIMNTNLEKVYAEFKNREDFLILSHTVEPEIDSVKILKEYANLHKVTDKRWQFVTGDKKQLYNMARKGYLLNDESGNGDEDDFIHTQNFALVDKDFHIRGFYDGTDSKEIDRLIQEIKLLMQEYDFKENNNR
ncbi:MAG: SCO family protein [Bacteroidota bacterium]|nr:SCO family protein [Bacteroidota bacterium]